MSSSLKVLHAFNRHRGGGGSDNAWDASIQLCREHGLDVATFSRDSRELPDGVAGKCRAFAGGIYSREAVRDFVQALESFQPDVVHAHELYPLISPWILPECTRAGVPVVMTCYDFRLTCPMATHFRKGEVCLKCLGGREYWAVLKNCRGNWAESLAYALRSAVARRFRLFTDHVSHFIALAEFSRQWMMTEAGVQEDRIGIVPCAIPLPEERSEPAKGEYVGFAGRFVPEKGVELLIEAARKTGIPIKLAGNEPSHPAIRCGDPVECVMTASRQELIDFYLGARLLVVPSIWYEVFGIVAAEAMSLGVPVIAARIGGLQATIEDGVTGLLFDSGDVSDLAEKMERLWHDPQRCQSMGEAGRMHVAERFSGSAHVAGLLDAYQRARQCPVY